MLVADETDLELDKVSIMTKSKFSTNLQQPLTTIYEENTEGTNHEFIQDITDLVRLGNTLEAHETELDNVSDIKYSKLKNFTSSPPSPAEVAVTGLPLTTIYEENPEKPSTELNEDTKDLNSIMYHEFAIKNASSVGINLNFLDESVKLDFLKKVFSIVLLQLSVTYPIANGLRQMPQIGQYAIENPWMILVPIFAMLITVVCMSLWKNRARRAPYNCMLLILYAGSFSFLQGLAIASDKFNLFLLVTNAFFVIVLTLVLFAFQSTVKYSIIKANGLCISIGCCYYLVTYFWTWSDRDDHGLLLLPSIMAIFTLSWIVLSHPHFAVLEDTDLFLSTDEYIYEALLMYTFMLRICIVNIPFINFTVFY